MPITLSVQTYRTAPPPEPLAARFDPLGGTIGRAAGNGLMLEDPSKYISRSHARIEFQNGAYCLMDVGSNPSLVNGRPLGNGRQLALHDGDRLSIGDYELTVAIAEEAGAAPLPLSPLQDAPAAPPPLQSDPVAYDTLASASILDCGPSTGGSDALQGNWTPQAMVPELGGFGAAQRSSPSAYRGAESDHVAPELQVFPGPVPVPAPQVYASPVPAAASAPSRAASPQAIPDDYDPLADYLPPRLQPVAPAAASAPAVAPPVTPIPDYAAPPAAMAFAPAAAVQEAAPAPESDSAVLAALLRGLGLSAVPMDRAPEDLAELAGSMLRQAAAGTMGVLLARALTKRESRLDVTMISSQSNNPLKFFPDVDSALVQMMGKPKSSYMPPVAAISAAFDDMKAHELALMAGTRAALNGVLERFDPVAIEKRLAVPTVMDKVLLTNRKAKLWDRMVESYQQVAHEADDDFQRIFGEQFARAYEEQVARMRLSRKQGGS
jgi:type VI secretion system FHA domain protein